jgi:hypothetical protein
MGEGHAWIRYAVVLDKATAQPLDLEILAHESCCSRSNGLPRVFFQKDLRVEVHAARRLDDIIYHKYTLLLRINARIRVFLDLKNHPRTTSVPASRERFLEQYVILL